MELGSPLGIPPLLLLCVYGHAPRGRRLLVRKGPDAGFSRTALFGIGIGITALHLSQLTKTTFISGDSTFFILAKTSGARSGEPIDRLFSFLGGSGTEGIPSSNSSFFE